ncbi:serine/threonine/tyrosine-interacting-like protein 1 isoform X8 [Callithrix jacchus]
MLRTWRHWKPHALLTTRLECSGVISALCNLPLPGSNQLSCLSLPSSKDYRFSRNSSGVSAQVTEDVMPRAAIQYGRTLTRLTCHPVHILKGGYERFSGMYPFFRTQKIIWMPQELDAFQPYPIEIVPGKVFLGNFSQACDPKIQKDLKIKAHINVSMETGPFFAGEADKLLHIRIEDSPEAQILPFLRHLCHFIEVLGLCQEVQKQHVSKSGAGDSAAGMGEDYPWRFHHKHHGSTLLISTHGLALSQAGEPWCYHGSCSLNFPRLKGSYLNLLSE